MSYDDNINGVANKDRICYHGSKWYRRDYTRNEI